MTKSRSIAALLGVAVLGLATPVHAQAESWPLRPIKFVVPFTPGGGNDILARVVGERLGQTLGQPVVIENRAGAAGNIGAEYVANSAPDGYTFLIAGPAIMAVNPHLYARKYYDAAKDFEPVGLLGALAVVLAVNPKVPAKSVAELIALAKSSPEPLMYASAGPGSVHHLAAELFKAMAGVPLVHVPYKGGIPAATDLIAGRVQVMFAPVNNLAGYVHTEHLRLLGVGGERRLRSLPDVPTIAEGGVPGYDVSNWIGLVAPTGTPKAIIARLNGDIARILAEPEAQKKIETQLMEPYIASPEAFAALIRSENARWSKVIRDLGIRLE